MKKEPPPEVIGLQMMGGVNLPWIEGPTFDGTILNWWPFWAKFQAAVHHKAHLGDVDKLTYLWDTLKGRAAMYVIQG